MPPAAWRRPRSWRDTVSGGNPWRVRSVSLAAPTQSSRVQIRSGLRAVISLSAIFQYRIKRSSVTLSPRDGPSTPRPNRSPAGLLRGSRRRAAMPFVKSAAPEEPPKFLGRG
jgi:hypothetical protein